MSASAHKPGKIGFANLNLKILYKSQTFSQSSQKSVKVVPKLNYCTFNKFETRSEQNLN